jgi:hypothetical protein
MTCPVADYHQHLYSPVIAPSAGIAPITAADLIKLLDAAGIRRAVVLSQAFAFGNPNRTPPVQNERARVIAENDWISHLARAAFSTARTALWAPSAPRSVGVVPRAAAVGRRIPRYRSERRSISSVEAQSVHYNAGIRPEVPTCVGS